MAANYGRPKPVDLLWYRFGWHLHVRCLCGHAADVELQDFAARRGLPASMRLHQMMERLRCSACGQPPLVAELVSRW
jgi:hypothetical protein